MVVPNRSSTVAFKGSKPASGPGLRRGPPRPPFSPKNATHRFLPALAFCRHDGVELAVAVPLDLKGLKELPPFVHYESARLFFFVDHVGRRSGRYAHRVGRKLMHLARFLEFSGLGDILKPLENYRL